MRYVNLHSQQEGRFLWKKAVDKPVEIVEKFGFSTAKPGICNCARR